MNPTKESIAHPGMLVLAVQRSGVPATGVCSETWEQYTRNDSRRFSPIPPQADQNSQEAHVQSGGTHHFTHVQNCQQINKISQGHNLHCTVLYHRTGRCATGGTSHTPPTFHPVPLTGQDGTVWYIPYTTHCPFHPIVLQDRTVQHGTSHTPGHNPHCPSRSRTGHSLVPRRPRPPPPPPPPPPPRKSLVF